MNNSKLCYKIVMQNGRINEHVNCIVKSIKKPRNRQLLDLAQGLGFTVLESSLPISIVHRHRRISSVRSRNPITSESSTCTKQSMLSYNMQNWYPVNRQHELYHWPTYIVPVGPVYLVNMTRLLASSIVLLHRPNQSESESFT